MASRGTERWLMQGPDISRFIAVRRFRMPSCSSSAHERSTWRADRAIPSNSERILPYSKRPYSAPWSGSEYIWPAPTAMHLFSPPRRPVLCVFLAGCRILLAEIFEAKSLLISDSTDTGHTLSRCRLCCAAQLTPHLHWALFYRICIWHLQTSLEKAIRPSFHVDPNSIKLYETHSLFALRGLAFLYISFTTTSLFSQR